KSGDDVRQDLRLDAGDLVFQLFVQRLKRRKLQLKDEITRVEAQILPDIIA
ncbi:MAG: DUF465 domain-containing protein, partial [Pseudomonadota bacterium]